MSRILCFTLLTSCLISTSAFADGPITGRVETNIRAGNERSIYMTEFWVPFAQSDNSVLYGDLRMMGDNQENREGNLGVGYRQITDAPILGRGVAGTNAWLDRRITARGSKFNQITLGGEWLGEDFDLRANGYIPLSDKREIEIPNANPQGPALSGTGIVVDTNGTVLEEPQYGLDLELGLELGQHFDFIKDNTDSFRVYGAGYYFNGDNTDDVAGWRTRFTADVSQNIQIGARFQRDDERGSQGFLEATFRFPFGSKRSYRKEGLRARLDESPERDIDIVTGEQVTDTGDRVQVLNQTTGAAQEVLHVDNTAAGGGNGSAENPFNTLADAQAASSAHTIIYVTQGDGTGTNQDQGIALNQTGQQLIGSGTNFVYDSGRFTTANGANPTSILIASATTAPVIGNVNAGQDGVTITADNVTVAGLTIDNNNTGRDGIVVEADGAAASAQNVTIQNVTTQNNRMGIYIHGANDGAVSAKVQSAITTANSQHGIAVYDDTDDTFTADLGGGELGSTGNNVLAGNTLEDLAVEYDGRALSAQNNWWGQASGADTDAPNIGIAPQIYYGAPINDGLVGHWTFDNEWLNGATAFDRSGNGNNGTLENGLTNSDTISSPAGEALVFDGTVYVQLPNINNIRSFHFLANVDSVQAANSYLFDARGGLAGGWFYSGIPNFGPDWSVMYANGANVALSYASLPKDQWSNTYYEANANFNDNVNLMSRFTNSEFSEGSLSDVRFYDRSLSVSEISELNRMDTSSSVNTSGFLSSAP